MSYNKIDGVYEVPTHVGPIWLTSQVINSIKSEFQAWMVSRPRRRVFDMRKRKELDEEEFNVSLHSINVGDAAGTYDWGGEAFQKAMVSLPGRIKLAVLLARDAASKHEPAKDQKSMTEARMFELVTGDKDTAKMLGGALDSISESTPNFLCPPTAE